MPLTLDDITEQESKPLTIDDISEKPKTLTIDDITEKAPDTIKPIDNQSRPEYSGVATQPPAGVTTPSGISVTSDKRRGAGDGLTTPNPLPPSIPPQAQFLRGNPAALPRGPMEFLPPAGSISPLAPPPMPKAPVPVGLQEGPIHRPEFPPVQLPSQPLPGFREVPAAGEQFATGLREIAKGAPALLSYGAPTALSFTRGAGVQPTQPPVRNPSLISGQPSADVAFRGASDVARGAMKASEPMVLGGAAIAAATNPAAAPLIAGGFAAGAAAQAGTEWGARKLGLPPGMSSLAGDIAGIGVFKFPGYKYAIEGTLEALTPESISPVKQAARQLHENVREMSAVSKELETPGISPEQHSQLLERQRQLSRETTLGLTELSRSNLLGSVKAAQIAGELPKENIPGTFPKIPEEFQTKPPGILEEIRTQPAIKSTLAGAAGPEGKAVEIPEEFPSAPPEVPKSEVPKTPGEVLAPETEKLPETEAFEAEAPGQETSAPEPKFAINTTRDLGLFSKLRQVVDEKLPRKLTFGQLQGVLKNAGVRQEEIDWIGLGEDSGYKPTDKISKEDLIGILENKLPDIKETVISGHDTQYGSYTTPGGENYREVLLSMPEAGGVTPYKEPHWYSSRPGARPPMPNVLAHYRTTDRTGPNGEKILHVEEVQSKWAQEGREKGFRPGSPVTATALTDQEWERLGDLLEKEGNLGWFDAIAARDEIKRNPNWIQDRNVQDPELIALGEKYRKYHEDLAASRTQSALPPQHPMPSGWSDLVLKRILRRASQEGYDAVTFTTGAQQNERYNLAQVVDKLEYYHQDHTLVGYKNGAEVYVQDRIKPEDLPDYVGKDVANKLLVPHPDVVSREGTPAGMVEGKDLEVGKQGKSQLYDVIIPSTLKKLTKQAPRVKEIGTTGDKYHVEYYEPGSRIGWIPIESYARKADAEAALADFQNQSSVWVPEEGEPIPTKKEDYRIRVEPGSPLEAWRVDLTPEVKSRALEPQPMFSITQGIRQGDPVTLAKIQARLPKGTQIQAIANDEKINPGGGTLGVSFPSGGWLKIRVTPGTDIGATGSQLAKQLGRPALPGEVAVGSYSTTGLGEQSIISLATAGSDVGHLDHELFHYAFDKLLTPAEQRSLLEAYGSEEGIAVAYQTMPEQPSLGILRDRARQIQDSLFPNAQRTLEAMKRQKIWERESRYGVDLRQVASTPGIRNKLSVLSKTAAEIFDRGLVRLESNPAIYQAATAAAPGVSASIAREAVISAGPKIAQVMKGGGFAKDLPSAWRAFAEVMIDSRLAGAQGRWLDLAQATLEAPVEELLANLQSGGGLGPDAPLLRVVQRIDAAQPGSVDPNVREHRVLEMIANGDPEAARIYLTHLFMHNHGAVKRLDLKSAYGKTLQEFAEDPTFQEALKIYKSEIEQPFMGHHSKNEGFLSADLGPLDTYYPLVAKDESLPAWRAIARQRGYLIRPHNPSNYFTLGLSQVYDPELSTLRSRLTSAIKGGNTTEFLKVLRDAGLAVRVGSPTIAEASFRGGEKLPAEVIPIGSTQALRLKGQTFKVPPQYIAVPQGMGRTVRAIVTGEGRFGSSAYHSEGKVEDIANLIVGWSLLGPSDAVFHAQAVLAGLTAGTPYIPGDSRWTSFLKNLPVAKTFAAAFETFKHPDSWFREGEGSQILKEMAPWGVLNPRTGGVMANPELAKLFGAEWRPPIWDPRGWRRLPEEVESGTPGNLWNYPHVAGRLVDLGSSAAVFGHPAEESALGRFVGLDTRARVALWQTHKKLFPDASPVDRANFTNQAMQYNWGLQGALEQVVKGNPITRLTSTFFTAAYSNVRYGIRSLNPAGSTYGMDRGANSLLIRRTQQALTSSITGYTLSWLLMNRALSGKWPWETGTPFGSVQISDGQNKSEILRKATGDNDKPVVVDMGFLNPRVWIAGRPVRDMINEAEALWDVPIGNDALSGLKKNQIAEAGAKAGLNMGLHLMTSGPLPRAGLALAGAAPWVQNLTDPTMGNPTFQLHTDPTVTSGPFQATGRTLMRELNQISPSAQLLAEQSSDILTGTPWSGPQRPGDPAKIFQTLNDIFLPRSRFRTFDPREAQGRAARRLQAKARRFLYQQNQKAQAKE